MKLKNFITFFGLLELLPFITTLSHNWTRSESLDGNGLYILEWRLKEQDIVFKATVNTRGFIALGFMNPNVKFSAFDLVLTWLDDRSGKANILVSIFRNAKNKHLFYILFIKHYIFCFPLTLITICFTQIYLQDIYTFAQN